GNPDLDGTWSDPDGNPHSGEYQPGISLPGGYTYTVTGDAPCPNASAIVVVTERRQPEAGISATFERCDTDAPVQLFNILSGTPDPGGVWTGPNGPSSGLFIPGTSDPGVYTYTLT